jgi:uncharacterized coiled-coil protein SlyX/type II secretory pathway component PulJ
MAQIIKHRRGSLEALSAVTSSLQKGEIVIASGSSNLTVTNGASLVFAVPENGQVQAVNRILVGASAPNTFSAGTYNGMLKGVPYYASGSSTLYLLGEGANEIPDLTGNISNFSSSVAVSINALSASIGGGSIGSAVTALNTFTASQEAKNSTLATYTASVDGHISDINSYTASNDTLNSLQTTRIDQLAAASASVNTFSASVLGHISDINSYTSSNDTTNTAQNSRLTNLESTSASVNISITNINSYTSSNDTTNTAQNARLTTLESVSGSYAILSGSNVFYGQQTITGSLYITQDLIVQGSSSLQNVTASAVNIGTNQLNLNTSTPAVRFAGVNVYDSGSSGVSASLQWDSLNDQWIFVHQESGSATVDSSILLYGPLSNAGLGSEATLAGNFLTKIEDNGHGHHLTTSSIEDTGTNVSIHNSLDVTGSLNIKDSAATFSIVGNGFSETYLQGNGGIVLQAGGPGVQIKSNNLEVQGTISGTTISGSSIAGLGNATEFSQSVSASIASVVANVGSGVGVSITNLNSFTSSQESKNSTLETYTASVDNRLGQLETNSGSQALQLSNLQSFTGSQESKNSTLATYTASVDSHISNVNSYTASNDTTNTAQNARLTTLEAFTGSQETKNSTLATYTASVDSKISQLIADSGSQNGRITSLESFSGSQNTKNSTLATYTASVDGRLSSIETFTSSFGTTFSSSVDSRLDTLEGTGTIQGVGTGNNVTFAKVTTTGDVIVGGDLVVQGNTVSLNTSTLTIEDKVITLASGSTNQATANGAGFEVAGALATFTYDSTPNAWTANIPISASAFTGSFNLPAGGSSKRIAFRTAAGNLDVVTAPTTSGDLLQWDGTDFVMSNTIDGGSF